MATIRQLKIFVVVAEYKKMNLAANKLYIAQPTVSRTIIDLEKEYDTILFERRNKELFITPAGLTLLGRAKEIISLYDNLERSMKNLNAKRPLKIGATLTIGNTMLSELIVLLNEQYPDIDVSVCVDNTRILEHSLLHNEVDLALVEGIITHKEIRTEPVFQDKLEIICSPEHPFTQQPVIRIEDLANQNFILRERGSGTRAIFENVMRSHHIPFTAKWECCSSSAILDAVRHNLGLGILSCRCVREAVRTGEVVICPVEALDIRRYFYLCCQKNRGFTSQMHDFSDMIHRLASPRFADDPAKKTSENSSRRKFVED